MDRQSGLLSLPPELLGNIINHIVDPDQWSRKNNTININWSYRVDKRVLADNEQCIRRKTISSLRLVNRILPDAANHVFCPILRIHLSEKSLSRAEEISSMLSMARAIRGIELILAYRPDNLANDLATFTRFKSKTLSYMEPDVGWEFYFRQEETDSELDSDSESSDESLPDSSFAFDQETLCEELTADAETEQAKEEVRLWVKASARGIIMRKTWKREASNSTRGQNKHQAARDVLRRGFQRFKQLHVEQRSLITTGTFATRLGTICTKMPNLQSLCFKVVTGDIIDLPENVEKAHILLNNEKIIDMLAEPLPWLPRVGDPRGNDFGATFIHLNVVAALFWDIPIALDRAGVPLRDLHILAFPGDGEFELGTPLSGHLGGTEEEFRKSMSRLESFHFAPSPDDVFVHLNAIPQRSAPQDRQTAEYIRLCTSSLHLMDFRLSLFMFEYRYYTVPEYRKNQYFELENILDHLEVSSLQSICIESASLSEASMKSLCVRLPIHLESCTLQDLYLYDGSWVEIADLLRSKIGVRVRSGKCQLCLFHLHSEEMYRYFQADSTWSHLTRRHMIGLMTHEKQTDSEPSYISGERDTNPFAVYRLD